MGQEGNEFGFGHAVCMVSQASVQLFVQSCEFSRPCNPGFTEVRAEIISMCRWELNHRSVKFLEDTETSGLRILVIKRTPSGLER